jgi:predicted lipoprotein with Yx(FWY)xxD motif
VPLHYWIKDAKPGDTTGQDVGSVWFVIPPAATGFPTIKVTKDPKLGNIITDLKGLTLYKYTKDEPNLSNCYDQCATNWPPLIVRDGDPTVYGGFPGKVGTTTRKDGAKQVTLDGVPLYYYVKDTKPGDTTGQGVGSVWYVIEVK